MPANVNSESTHVSAAIFPQIDYGAQNRRSGQKSFPVDFRSWKTPRPEYLSDMYVINVFHFYSSERQFVVIGFECRWFRPSDIRLMGRRFRPRLCNNLYLNHRQHGADFHFANRHNHQDQSKEKYHYVLNCS